MLTIAICKLCHSINLEEWLWLLNFILCNPLDLLSANAWEYLIETSNQRSNHGGNLIFTLKLGIYELVTRIAIIFYKIRLCAIFL